MSCLFDSLSKYIVKNSSELRIQICDYIEQNPNMIDNIKVDKVIQWEKNISLPLYVQNMRQNYTWGGAIEVKAFCNLYNIQVNIHLYNDKQISFYPSGEINLIININWTGTHFYIN